MWKWHSSGDGGWNKTMIWRPLSDNWLIQVGGTFRPRCKYVQVVLSSSLVDGVCMTKEQHTTTPSLISIVWVPSSFVMNSVTVPDRSSVGRLIHSVTRGNVHLYLHRSDKELNKNRNCSLYRWVLMDCSLDEQTIKILHKENQPKQWRWFGREVLV